MMMRLIRSLLLIAKVMTLRVGVSRSIDDWLYRVGVGNRSPVLHLLSRFGTRIWITVGLTIFYFALMSLSSSRRVSRRACCADGLK